LWFIYQAVVTQPLRAGAKVAWAINALALYTDRGVVGTAGAGAAVAGAGGAGAGRAVAVRADHLTPLHSHTVHLLFCTARQRIRIIFV
jgi:hypothetical protein